MLEKLVEIECFVAPCPTIMPMHQAARLNLFDLSSYGNSAVTGKAELYRPGIQRDLPNFFSPEELKIGVWRKGVHWN